MNFTIVIPWQSILDSIYGRWGLESISIRVRYTILDEHKTAYWVASEDGFRMIYTIHNLYKKQLVEMEADDMEGTIRRAPSKRPQHNRFVTDLVLFVVSSQIVKVVKVICTGCKVLVVSIVSYDAV